MSPQDYIDPPTQNPNRKSTTAEIRQRFDNDVERFSQLEVGQQAAVDGSFSMELIAEASALTVPNAKQILDLGCGAGNFSLRLLQQFPQAAFTLVDLSQPMLSRAQERLRSAGCCCVSVNQEDLRQLNFLEGQFDLIVAAAVLHHLRTPQEWEQVFASLYHWLVPGGAVWIFDLVESDTAGISKLMWTHYARYLREFKGSEYQRQVFDYIAAEDTPYSLTKQLEILKNVGFSHSEILHKRACFAAYGAVKTP